MKKVLSLVTILLLLVVGKVESAIYTANGAQDTEIKAIAAGMQLDFVGTVTAIGKIVDPVTVIGTDIDIRNLNSSQDSVSAVQSGNWSILGITNVVHVDDNAGTLTVDAVNFAIRALTSADIVSAVQSGAWSVSVTDNVNVTATDLDIRNLGYAADSVKIYGSEGVPVKTDATGQIYAITSAATVDAVEKAVTFANIATGSWVEIGSYTVTTGKSGKFNGMKFTGGYDCEFKISDGTTGDEMYGQTSPASPSDNVEITHPAAKVATTVLRMYVKTTEAVNSGTVRLQGYEYTP